MRIAETHRCLPLPAFAHTRGGRTGPPWLPPPCSSERSAKTTVTCCDPPANVRSDAAENGAERHLTARTTQTPPRDRERPTKQVPQRRRGRCTPSGPHDRRGQRCSARRAELRGSGAGGGFTTRGPHRVGPKARRPWKAEHGERMGFHRQAARRSRRSEKPVGTSPRWQTVHGVGTATQQGPLPRPSRRSTTTPKQTGGHNAVI